MHTQTFWAYTNIKFGKYTNITFGEYIKYSVHVHFGFNINLGHYALYMEFFKSILVKLRTFLGLIIGSFGPQNKQIPWLRTDTTGKL